MRRADGRREVRGPIEPMLVIAPVLASTSAQQSLAAVVGLPARVSWPAVEALEQRVWQRGLVRVAALSEGARRQHGVVHTPPELATRVVALADRELRASGLALGLADPRVLLADPACGTGAFLAAALSLIEPRPSRPRGVWAAEIDRDTLADARDLLAPALEAAGIPLEFVRRDALECPACAPASAFGSASDTLVVALGNPPWTTAARVGGRDAPVGLMDDFRRLPDGSPLSERKLGVLSDAYVRFMRWTFEAARCAPGGGLVSLITNGSFIDGPVHRGMRAAMLGWSDALTLIDLGGNAMLTRAGRRDDNVFGVRPSVAITLARIPAPGRVPAARAQYARLWGERADKQAALSALASGQQSELVSVHPAPPSYAFVPARAASRAYAAFIPLPEAMPFQREGVQTNRDGAAVADTREDLLARLRAFVDGAAWPELAVAYRALSHYDPARARARVAAALAHDPEGTRGHAVMPIAYRPGQLRYFCPVAPLCHRPRPDLLRAMARSKLALLSVRKDRGDRLWRHVGLVEHVADSSYLSARSSCRTRVFPTHTPAGVENLSPAVIAPFERVLGRPLASVDFVLYAFAVLSSPAFQVRHDGALRADYARVPVPESRALFDALIGLARELRAGDAGALAKLDACLPVAWLA